MRFQARQRLCTDHDFVTVRKTGKRFRHDGFLAQVTLRDTTPSCPRLGLRVSRKIGNAVSRNRVKRKIRELFRRHQKNLPLRCDLIVVPYPTFLSVSSDSLNGSFQALCDQLQSPATF